MATTQTVNFFLFFIFSVFLVHALDCPNNEVQVTCPDNCPYDYCPTKPDLPQICGRKSNICLVIICKCGFNYSRSKNGTCIPTRDCPPFNCTGPNEVYNPCPPFCPTDDCSQASPTGECPTIPNTAIVVPCKPNCRCKENYWRKNDTCVPYAQCDKNTTETN